jgi:serine/threonine protein kinase
MSPELARVLSVQGWFKMYTDDKHDMRQVIIWKFGVILFGILHGYWPWDDQREGQGNLLDFGSSEAQIPRVMERRARIMSDPLLLNESLSQDCKDVLRAMLALNPEDRPSLRRLATSYPWFLQWTYANRVWRRPFSRRFHRHSFKQSSLNS